MLALRSVAYALLLPGTVAVLVPYYIVSGGAGLPARWTALQYVGVVAMLAGAAVLVRCIWEFAARGRGTLAPIDPPTQLVAQGLYRYVRNPMYLGVLALLLGECAFFQSRDLLWYTAGWFIVVNLFVILYEEPALRRRFGESYERYRRAVGRWLPRCPA